MIDVFMVSSVTIFFAMIVALLSRTYTPRLRTWLWLAFVEYFICAAAQLMYTRLRPEGGDPVAYALGGKLFAHFLDENFRWAGPELFAMFFQQPSGLDQFLNAPQSNTGSMYAACGALTWLLRGSDIAASVAVAGLSLLSTLAMHRSFRELYAVSSETHPERLFIATVMIPSIPFWTSGLYKEPFCVMGFGLVFSAWAAVRRSKFIRGALTGVAGFTLVFLYRAPSLIPLALGVIAFYFSERTGRLKRRESAAVLGPVYAGLAVAAFLGGLLLLARYVPSLAVSQVGETVAGRQQAWSTVSGGSTIGADDPTPTTIAGQLLALPFGLANALFRPQFFDIRNASTVVSAAEMTLVTWILFRALRRRGVRGVIAFVRASPFLAMCAVMTIVGCALVGLVTRNFGSLVRYRTPFFPFYGSLIMSLAFASPIRVKAQKPVRSAALELALERRDRARR